MPAMIFINVDLPAPFSPISACTLPARRRKATWSSATTPGNALTMPSISSNGGAAAIAASPGGSAVAEKDMACRGAAPGARSVLAHVFAQIGGGDQLGRGIYKKLDRLLLC